MPHWLKSSRLFAGESQAKINSYPQNFVGRQHEWEQLVNIGQSGNGIVVVYGRRRVGKTELLEQVFRNRNIIKLEGVEGLNQEEQRDHVLRQLSEYVQDPWIAKIRVKTWTDIFNLISTCIKKGKWTLYFEEVQWLSEYQPRFVNELKYIWDNHWRHNKNLIVILCGSATSFMTKHVVHSQALYNRSVHEMHLREFSLAETRKFLKKCSLREVMDAYLIVGGIPEYLRWINKESSIFLGLCKHSFTSGSFFSHEYKRLFISSLSDNKDYKKITEFLAKNRFSTRDEILTHLKTTSGGTLTALLQDLETCGLIEKYVPFHLKEGSLLSRYVISDAYLQFYFKFIKPIQKNIENGDYNLNPTRAIKSDTLDKWLGHSFERGCRRQHRLIAKLLGFESVEYKSGAFFSRSTQKQDENYQLDLVFERADKVYTICEIKYLRSKVTSHVIAEFEKKISLFPNPKKYTLHKVLITAEGAENSVMKQGFFDRIITLTDLFNTESI